MIRLVLACFLAWAAFASTTPWGVLWAALAAGLVADLMVNPRRRA